MNTDNTETAPYVGELIRKRIKEMKVLNGFVIDALKEAGMEMSDTVFSNKIYGGRDKFNVEEVKKISKILKTDFSAGTID